MKNYCSKLLLVFVLCIGFSTNAQDSLSVYQHIENQFNQFRILNTEFYYNPANMADYSTYSFSNINLNYQNLDKQSYLLQEGASHKRVKLQVSSYKATAKNITLWGNAAYTNTQTQRVQWNNNIDIERINPVVIADSIGGKMNLQTYNFKGGFAKNVNKFTYGLQLAYTASLNYKTQDPRPKNVTSDLHILFGTNYRIKNNYKIGLAAGINRYIQTSEIKFSSEIRQNALYQMNGLGTYNFYFSNKSQNAVYTDFTHNYLLTFGSTNNLFSVTAGTLFGNLSKDIDLGSNNTYETNKLALQNYVATITKLFNLNNNLTIGGKIYYNTSKKTGTEVFYTNNTDIVTKLLEKENYQLTINKTTFNLVFQHQNNSSTFFAQPYFSVMQTKESKFDTTSYQNFKYNFIGTKLFYLQQINSKNTLNLQANLYKRNIKNTASNLVLTQHIGINQWLTNDFNLKQTNYNAIEAAFRYDRKLLTKQSIYIIFALDYYRFANKTTNTQSTISLGITF